MNSQSHHQRQPGVEISSERLHEIFVRVLVAAALLAIAAVLR